VIFAAIPRTSNSSEEGSESDVEPGKRSKSRISDEPMVDDDDLDLFSASRACPSKQFGQRIAECDNLWQVLALNDMTEDSKRKSRHTGRDKRQVTAQNQREGEESLLCRKEYDREPVWRFLDVLVQGWRSEIAQLQGEQTPSIACEGYVHKLTLCSLDDHSEGESSSHLTNQLQEVKEVKGNNGRSSRKEKVGPSDALGEVFEVIFAGLSPTSLMNLAQEDERHAQKNLNERVRRGEVAAAILVQVSMSCFDASV
jgi:hypothetical protein